MPTPIVCLVMLFTLDTKQIQMAMDAATAGGKPYLLPAGTHSVGTLKLKSGTLFRFAPGAVIKMLRQNSEYSPIEKLDFEPYADLETSRFEHALFFASDADGVTIDGPGRIECDRGGRGGPKPISLRRCKNVKLSGFTIDQAPNYAISLIGCLRVDIGNVKITRSHADGIDLDSTSDAFIHDVEVDSFDDAICLKASASLGKKMATRNIKLERCRLRSASVFFKVGTESYGDFQGITARGLTMIGGAGNRHGNPGIALETVDGGKIRNVEITDVAMENVGTPIFLRIGERKKAPGSPGAGEMSGIELRRIRATGTRHASVLAGLKDAPIRSLTLDDVEVDPVGGSAGFDPRLPVGESPSAYPEPIQFGPIPASAFFIRHVSGLRLRDMKYSKPASTPAILLDHVLGNWKACRDVGDSRFVCNGGFESKP